MNAVNVKKAIGIMSRARADHFNMSRWQTRGYSHDMDIAITEDALHTCGNQACFAGYVALAPEFRVDGGTVDDRIGSPIIMIGKALFSGAAAISVWLDISSDLAGKICMDGNQTDLYGKHHQSVTPQDVITVLERLLNGKYGRQESALIAEKRSVHISF